MRNFRETIIVEEGYQERLPKKRTYCSIGRSFARKKYPGLKAFLRVSRDALGSAAQAVLTVLSKNLWRLYRTNCCLITCDRKTYYGKQDSFLAHLESSNSQEAQGSILYSPYSSKRMRALGFLMSGYYNDSMTPQVPCKPLLASS